MNNNLQDLHVNQLIIETNPINPNDPVNNARVALRGRTWPNQQIAVPYFVPVGTSPDLTCALDLMMKGDPPDNPGSGVVWYDLCDTTEERIARGDLEGLRFGKFKRGLGQLSMFAGSDPSNVVRSLVLQLFGGNVMIGTTVDGMTPNGSFAIKEDLAHRGSKAGFFNHAPVQQQKKADHNNWATMQDILSALANLGLIDSV